MPDPLKGIANINRVRPITPQKQQQQLPLRELKSGDVVRGHVVAKEGNVYLVRVNGQLLNARATVPLNVGQRFTATLDKSGEIPLLHLMQGKVELLAGFKGLEKFVAQMLFQMGLAVSPQLVKYFLGQLKRLKISHRYLRALIQLWARGVYPEAHYLEAVNFYLSLSPEDASALWRNLRSKLKKFYQKIKDKDLSEQSTLDELDDLTEEEKNFLLGQKLLLMSPRSGLVGDLNVPLWFPVSDYKVAKLYVRTKNKPGGGYVYEVKFDVDMPNISAVSGKLIANDKNLFVSFKTEKEDVARLIEENKQDLAKDLKELGWNIWDIVSLSGSITKEGFWEAIGLTKVDFRA